MKQTDKNKWRAMQIQYRLNLRHKAESIQQNWMALQQNTDPAALTQLQHLSHQLAGSGSIYGFPDVSRYAKSLNHLLQSVEPTKVSNDTTIKLQLADLIQELNNHYTDEYVADEPEVPLAALGFNHAKIVFVDDDTDMLQYHRAPLEAAGYHVIELQDIKQLSATVAEQQPLAAICDMVFPEGETAGADYLIALREQQGINFPVIFISAFDTFDSRLAAVRAGSSHFLAKPVSSQALIQMLANLLQPQEANPYRILLVDDDADVLRFYRQALQLAGYQIFCTNDPKNALTLMIKHQPELVLIDLHMPGCHGLELGQVIRQHNELVNIPIVFMSADESTDEKLAAVRLAGDEFIHKPIAPWRLLMVVEARVKRSRLLQQQKRQIMRQPELVQHLDTLTALPTLWLLKKDIEHLQQNRQPFYILKLNLNKFHLVNDVYGHGTGDLLLQTVAWKLAQQLRAEDKLYRQNGDEFWLLIHSADVNAVQKLAEKLLFQLSQHSEAFHANINLSASIGLCASHDQTANADTLMQQANMAQHEAKKTPGYQIRCYNSTMQSNISKRYQIQQSLKQALLDEAFYPVYQPIVNSQGMLKGFELLSRWQHSEFGPIAPDTFIPLLEEEGLISQLTQQMLHKGLAQLAHWRKTLPELTLSINLSVPDIADAQLPELLQQLLQKQQLPATALTLEITESILIQQKDHITKKLEHLKMQGFSIALDDFGTGYSSLSYLNNYPVDILKIDRSFVSNLSDPKARRLTLAIIHLAKELELKVTAEGVEQLQQLSILQDEYCHFYQGYYFSKPLTVAELEQSQWLQPSSQLLDT
ncbi:putative bifunctional diguanylate cyclase/phosphodiesterase [Alishewanella sp. HL-SH06]|uniref:putative bifunctional diguanylate cyclase/phosphodiesterase n=1 Tax=Alishewanella sp. HL-SH06 TaxID=3461144 RepID=UPI004041DA0E